ncbi:glutathione S-transferase family protein [Cupriavidus taiwanensis]|uniref:GLUTATHIONE S-TRANSFERASE PROTEIN, GST superfamily, Beta family n=1 Tax=Cupriavidus taiwanensis (strain DSM 17343 / BCRC 17206 / CCUG 44338 / CIP 107171 / LMG 19424 / R1) TaxID=977880 RepID=B3R189_CUPTR|nr:glutathione S-transferase family protein [Cupriavidus taiwanensis]CAQ69498.1 putative GLUTATHIONE S-TRANSFERASE PROTEIN, GST superfamily, Beta family [Cupriavidus taiwanensis LMG 19424]SPC14401.1 putative GLUTATHIONE S-TRANSFERASE PROTEIN, GST superfamily, Beta family [Cupriavidus taiwanensis]
MTMTLYYNPQSRASVARWMLEEVGADYALQHLDIAKGESRAPAFLAINPMGKIPTLVLDDGTVLTENGAIIAWLADAYPKAGLMPPAGSSARGTVLRWLFFCGSCFEPALTDRMMRAQAPLPKQTVGWGDYDEVIDAIEKALSPGPFVLGDSFSAADVYLGASLAWAGQFGAPRVRESRRIQDYVGRITARDAFVRAQTAQ